MSETQAAPRLQKWPFYLADLVLSGIAGYVLYRLGAVQNSSSAVISLACLIAAGWGAWLSISPWLLEYRTQSDLSESTNLKSSLEQIQNLEKVADSIRQANSQWQAVQDASGRTVVAAREIAERMKLETEEFMKFMDNAHEQERAGLRLEVEKLRRMEGDWIKVTVQMLDHVFALYRAAEKSGQQNLVSQLAQFQGACRDVARRMGLTPFLPVVGENFDSRGHQLTDAQATPAEGATVADILATGFTYQGQLLRRALVIIGEPGAGRDRISESLPQPAAMEPQISTTVPSDAPTPASHETTAEVASPETLVEGDPAADEEPPQTRRARSRAKATDQNQLPLV